MHAEFRDANDDRVAELQQGTKHGCIVSFLGGSKHGGSSFKRKLGGGEHDGPGCDTAQASGGHIALGKKLGC